MERHSRSYFRLIKPGITLSNTIAGIAGFFLATSIVPFSISAFIGTVVGIACIIASACVVNNIIDRDIDKQMKRTVKRDVANGKISVAKALMFATVLGLIGFISIMVLTNLLTFIFGVTAYIWYVVIYGYAKRTTVWSTVIGSVAGALPPAAGYTALTGRIDGAAIILFFILFFWQIPHFYAIAMFRKSDYTNANIPIWSVRFGQKSTKRQILGFAVVYGLTATLLTICGYTGVTYLLISSMLSLYWILSGIYTYRTLSDEKWAGKMFGISLLVLLSMCALVAIGGYLP